MLLTKLLTALRWYAPTLTLAGSPLASNVKLVRKINAGGNGYDSFNPLSSFNALKVATTGDDLTIEAKPSAISGGGFIVDNGSEAQVLVGSFPAASTNYPVALSVLTAAQAGTYVLPTSGAAVAGLTSLSYSKGLSTPVSGTVTLAQGDVLYATGTTASGVVGTLILTRSQP